MKDEMDFIISKFGKLIHEKLETFNIGASFFVDSEKYADEIVSMGNSLTYLNETGPGANTPFKVTFFQDYSFDTEIILHHINLCKLQAKDGTTYKFIKVITPFTRDKSYDLIIFPMEDAYALIKELELRSKIENFKLNDQPVVGTFVDEVVKEVQEFFYNEELRKFLEEKKIPIKRGYVFEGVPGNGKTFTINRIKKFALENGIRFEKFGSPKEFLDDYRSYYRDDEKKIFVFEDFDNIIKDRDLEDGTPNSVLGTLLNVLDGIDPITEVVTIFTTNKVNILDSAFIRPGRIDKVITFFGPNKEQVLSFFYNYVSHSFEHFETMYNYLVERNANITFASLKGICDDINISYFYNNYSISIDKIKEIMYNKLKSGNRNNEVKATKEYIL